MHAWLDILPDAAVIVDRAGLIVHANVLAQRLFGHHRDDMQGKPVEHLIPEDLRSRHIEHRQRYAEDPSARRMDTGLKLRARHSDGHEFPVEVSLGPLQTKEALFIVCCIRDMTRHQRLQEQLQSTRGRLIDAQEEERRRIAREIHDDVGQRLALTCVQLDLLGQSLQGSAVEFRHKMEQVAVQIRQVSSELHDLSHALHPTKLAYVGIVPALRSLCHDVAGHNDLDIDFSHRAVPSSLHSKTSLCLYRVVQQALANVIQHSGSTNAAVDLVGDPETIHLRIVDSGVGFDPASADNGGGLGLISMRDRVRLIHGTISIESEVSRGTLVDVRVPRQPVAAQAL